MNPVYFVKEPYITPQSPVYFVKETYINPKRDLLILTLAERRCAGEEGERLKRQVLKRREDAAQADEVLEVLVAQLSELEHDLEAFNAVWGKGPAAAAAAVRGVAPEAGVGGSAPAGGGLLWLLPDEHGLRTRHGQQLHSSLAKALSCQAAQTTHPAPPALFASPYPPNPGAVAAPQRLSPSHPHSPSIFRNVVWTPHSAASGPGGDTGPDGHTHADGNGQKLRDDNAGEAAGGAVEPGAEGREGVERTGGAAENARGGDWSSGGEVERKEREIDALKREVDVLRGAIRARAAASVDLLGNGEPQPPAPLLPTNPAAAGLGSGAGAAAAVSVSLVAPKTYFSQRMTAGDAPPEMSLPSSLDGISITENTATEDDSLSAASAWMGGGTGLVGWGVAGDVEWDSVSVGGESVPQMRLQIEVLQKRVREQEAKSQRLLQMSQVGWGPFPIHVRQDGVYLSSLREPPANSQRSPQISQVALDAQRPHTLHPKPYTLNPNPTP